MNSKALSLLVMLGLVSPLTACSTQEGGEKVQEQAPTAPAQVNDGGKAGEKGAPAPGVKNDDDEGGEGGEDGAPAPGVKNDDDEGGEGGEG